MHGSPLETCDQLPGRTDRRRPLKNKKGSPPAQGTRSSPIQAVARGAHRPIDAGAAAMAPFRRPRPAGATKPAPDGAASTLLSTWQQQKHLPPIDPKLSGEQVRRGMKLGRFELTRKLQVRSHH